MTPIYVCVPAGRSRLTGYAGTFSYSDREEWSPEPVGHLDGYAVDLEEPEALGKLNRDLKSVGLKAKFLIRSVVGSHGRVGAQIAFGVLVPDYETALELDRFVPLAHHTRSQYPPPDAMPPIGPTKESGFFPGSRTLVGELYKNFAPPPYDDDGMFVLSLVSVGQLAALYFFKDQPEYVYAALYGSHEPQTNCLGEREVGWLARKRLDGGR